jgi:hypothetical protein
MRRGERRVYGMPRCVCPDQGVSGVGYSVKSVGGGYIYTSREREI